MKDLGWRAEFAKTDILCGVSSSYRMFALGAWLSSYPNRAHALALARTRAHARGSAYVHAPCAGARAFVAFGRSGQICADARSARGLDLIDSCSLLADQGTHKRSWDGQRHR